MPKLSMERLSSKTQVWVLILLLAWISGCKGCIKDEKRGLLEFKAFLKSSGENADALLPSWIDSNSSECCGWERVVCDPTTGRVIKLFLNDVRQSQYLMKEYSGIMYYRNDKFWLLNTSMFLPFEELRHLNLSANSFDGFIRNEGFMEFSNLKKLEILDICGNEFDRSVLKTLGMITSVKTLSLCSLGLNGSFPVQELALLKNLEVLDLQYNDLESFPLLQEWASLRNLKVLDLTGNQLESFQLVQDSNNSIIFGKLEILYLNNNYFTNTSIQQLNIFTSLKRLSLRRNLLEGFFSIQDFASLSKLEVLDVSNNYFTMIAPASIKLVSPLRSLSLTRNWLNGPLPIQALTSLTKLEILDLSYNFLSGIIPSSIELMSSLKSLSLAYNQLNGSLSNQGLCQLNKLQELDLNSNFLEGILPPCLNSLTSLRLLDLSRNVFSGNTTSSVLANLTSLEYIDLSNNLFEGSFSFSCFANHSKLQVVIIGSGNKFLVEAEDSIGWVPLFQLKVLVLSSCKLTGGLPNFLHYQFKLMALDLSHNDLIEKFPFWLLENNTRLEYLHLRNNFLLGQVLLRTPNTHIQSLDISNNQFDGQLQENLADMIPNVEYLNLSNNGFKGILSSSVAELKHLWILDLSTNNFSGELPKKLVGVQYLVKLILSNNKFEGEIFSADFNSTSLEHLYLNNNRFSGTLSNITAKSFWSLRVLDVSNNNMSGEIPGGICNITSLYTLVLGSNGFSGRLPHEISQLPWLKFIDISHNDLSGHLPSLITMENLKYLHLEGNMFEGSIPIDFLNSSSLLTLDVRDNKLIGSIPSSIFTLSELRILLLGGNLLSGLIPNQLCRLRNISLMDLSNNKFSGSIPKCFSLIQFGGMRTGTYVFRPYFQDSPWGRHVYEGNFAKAIVFFVEGENGEEEEEVEFVTKYNSYSYKGDILDFMSGLDLSSNNLTGEIPHELGMLKWIHALNLSHNQLKGIIPKSFFNLSQIESLDLSYNQLSGQIPPELVELSFLSAFSVAHNNISGSVPNKAQFTTFGESSYESNPFLCGQLSNRKCNNQLPNSSLESSRKSEEKWYNIDGVTFFASFATSYVTILLAFVVVLCINAYWRRRWFTFIEECIYSCYYFTCQYSF